MKYPACAVEAYTCAQVVGSATPSKVVLPWNASTETATDEGIISSGIKTGRCDNASNELERTMLLRTMNNGWRYKTTGLLCCCLLFVAPPRCKAQNLVPNPGFEETDSCWMGIGIFPQGAGPSHWYSANVTPDHLLSCLPYGAVNGLPMNFLTFQHPFEGNNCAGLMTYHQNGPEEQREWIMAPLMEPLVPGQTYYCSFRANAAFGGNAQYPQVWLANDKVGMLFTTNDRHWYLGDPLPTPPNYAHIMYPQILADTVGWTLVSGSFVADSAYQYVMIGQFFSNALTDTLHFADPNSVFPWYPWGYTLIDAVCVSASPDGCDMSQGIAEGSDAGTVLFPNPAQHELVVAHANGAQAAVYDALGREVWNERITGDRWALDVSRWPRGAYVLRMEWGAKWEAFKFVLTD
jgi:hypothetical protein